MMHMMCFCIQFQLHDVVGGGDGRKIPCATRSTQCNTTPVSSKAFFAAPTTKHSHLTPVKKEMLLLQEHCKREHVTNYLSSSRRLFQPDSCQPRQRKKQTKQNSNPTTLILGRTYSARKTWCFLLLPEASEKRLTPFVSSPSTLRSAFCLSINFSSLEGRKGEEALASREGEKYAIDGGAIEGNRATAALAATSLVIEDEEVETKKKKKQDLVFDSAAPAGGSRNLWKTDQKEQHGGPSLKDHFVSGSCCSPFADATES